MKIVILAGGLGQRLWPLSRAGSPKHVQPLFGKLTLLQQTVGRLQKHFRRRDVFIVTGQPFKKTVLEQLPRFPKKNIIFEPARKNTAAAIGLAAYTLAKTNPQEIMISIASDHFIGDTKKFISGLKLMERVIKAEPQGVCLMGIKPSYPETGYGYIEIGQTKILGRKTSAHAIKKFVEKPKLKMAARLLRSNRYFWNPSYFAWRVDRVRSLFEEFLPATHQALVKTVGGKRAAFLKIPPIAIEYGILEKLRQNFFVIPAHFPWADIGHWASVREIRAKSDLENVTLGLSRSYATTGCLVYNYSPGLVTTVGVKDLLIIQTEDGTLVCHKDRAQDVKKLVEQMQKDKKLRKFL